MTATGPKFGVSRGKVFPASEARMLLNPLRRLVQPPRRIVAALDPRPDWRVLELGCGPGYFSFELLRRLPRGRVCLFDLQTGMLELAGKRLREGGFGNFERVQGDVTALPYRDDSFDGALLVTVLGEVPDPGACLGEVRRVLKPGGRLAISEVRGDADFNPPGWTRATGEAAGLEFIRMRGIRWNYTMTFRNPEAPNDETAGRQTPGARGGSRPRD